MKRMIFLAVPALLLAGGLHAQHERRYSLADVAASLGSKEGTVAASYVYNMRLGKRRRAEVGLGVRWTSYFGGSKNFTTAPGRLARSTTIPFVIVFAGQETQNWDTLTVQSPVVHSLNLTANFGYRIGQRWLLGFNIDLAGVTFGQSRNATLTSNGIPMQEPAAKPARWNLLLTGDNDYGSLNSEFFLRYKLTEKWSIRGIYDFYFAEYKTNTVFQTAPDGTVVNRFRNKVNALGIGVSYFPWK
jgi:hypothetical protein